MSASDDNYVLAKELFLEIIAYERFVGCVITLEPFTRMQS